jgi:23S rRNA (guanosine2251-2'-O)-methyltransferase
MSLIIGRKPVLEAINSGESIEQVFILYGQRGGIVDAIRVAAKKKGIKLSELSSDKFSRVTDNPNTQGVAARVSQLRFYTIEELVASAKKGPYPLFVILDSIQDPHNLGAIIRTAECSGADGVIITQHNSAPVSETVIKTAAGATGYIKLCTVGNLANSLGYLKENGFWIFGSSLDNAVNYSEPDYNMPAAVVFGNEEKGIRRLTAENCDVLIKIPMYGNIQSLNVSVSAGVILFEILRKRNLTR